MNDLYNAVLAYLMNNRAYDVTSHEIRAHFRALGFSGNQIHDTLRFLREDRKIEQIGDFNQITYKVVAK